MRNGRLVRNWLSSPWDDEAGDIDGDRTILGGGGEGEEYEGEEEDEKETQGAASHGELGVKLRVKGKK